MSSMRSAPLNRLLSHVGMDLASMYVWFAGFDLLVAFASRHLVLALTTAILLQILALGTSSWRDQASPNDTTPHTLQMLTYLANILAAGAFLWVSFGWLAISGGENPAGYPVYWVHILVALFGGIAAVAVPTELGTRPPSWLPLVATTTAFVYVMVLEATLSACLATGHVSPAMIGVATLLSYLPVRLTLATDTRAHPVDLVSGLTAYAAFCGQLFPQ